VTAAGDALPTALVTGAGSGIGRQVTLSLLDAGWHVVLAGRREERLRETADEAPEHDQRMTLVETDVRDPASVDALFARVDEERGRLDLLFNNAGSFGTPAPIEDVELAEWRAVVDTNLTGAFLCAQAAVRAMKAQIPRGGRIINNGSISAVTPRPNAVAYTATKHAVTGLTKAIVLEGRRHDIACGQIDIGNAATDMTAATERGILQADDTIASEPTMDVRHVGEAVSYMAGLPLEANVEFMTVMATKMPFAGRG
jgi:NAD(P)-dependent dehydrogenase (short-subunit alcohol dehydrogenase family)